MNRVLVHRLSQPCIAKKERALPSSSLRCHASLHSPSPASAHPIAQRRVSRSLKVYAAASDIAEDVDDLEDGAASDEDLAAAKTAPDEESRYALNLLWMESNIGIAVDQIFSPGMRSPVTEYFFWPRVDAWEELKTDLEGKPWISTRERVLLLNLATEIINFWQTEDATPTVEQAQKQFSSCVFRG